MLERWDKYDPTGNYEENPVKNTEKNIISKKENDKKISNNGEITGDRTQLNNTIEISTGGGILIGKSIVGNVQNQELIAINGLDNSISNISKVPEKDVGNNGEITEGENIGNINKDSIKVDPDKKEEIEIEGGNISSEDVNEVGTTGDSGKNGANGNEGGRYEHGEAGGSGTNGGSVTGKKDITINKDNITVTGGQGGLGGTGGAGGNGGIGGSATGIQTNGDITNIGDITVIAGIGGTGGNGGDDKYTHTWGGKGGTGGDGGTAIGIETSDGTIKNQGSIIAIGGNAGTGGQGGHWGGNKGPDAEDGKNGINGNGIGIKGDNNTIFNEGTLIGSNTAVSGNNNNITNIGIIGTGTGNDIITGTGNNLINAGVTVKVDNTGKITSIIESSENTKVEINGKNYTSIHMKNEIGNQSNKIINATNDTKHLIIGQDTTIKDSIVNGVDYDNASIIVNKGTTKIEGTTINSLNDNAIKINDETTLIFSGSFADGNIDLSNGNNSLIFSNGSSLTGKIETGTGNNELIFDKAKYELELDLSKGNDNITIKNGSLLGEIKLGEGNNKVVIENAEYNKNLDMTKGDDELYLQNGGIYTGKIDFGEGNNKLIINNTSINNNFDLANGNNEIKTINTILEGNLTAGTGNDTLTANTSIIKGDIALGEGLNNIDLTNSGIEGSITTGSGDDIFNIISSVVKGNLNTGDGNNQITISGSNMGIEGNITAGTGDDTFKLTENGIVTGNVDLGTGSNTANIAGEIGGNLISKGSTSIIDLVKGKIFGNIELGDGLSNLTMKDGSGIKGNVTATGSKDNVFDLTNSTIGGKLEAGSGNNTITLKENSGILNGIVTGTGNDTLTANTSVIKGDIALGEGLNNIQGIDSILIGNIITGNDDDEISYTNTYHKGNINLENGNNTISLKENSIISGNVVVGNDNDTITLSDSQIQGNIDLKNGDNILNVDSKSYIFGAITAGTGNDNITLETDLTAKNNKYFDLNITLGNDNSNEINNLKIGSNNYLDGIVKGSLGKDNIMIGNSDTGTNIINLELSGIENVTLQGNTKISANSKLYADKITVTGSGDTYLELDVDINKNAGIHTGHGLYGNTGIYETLEKDSHLIIDTSKINNNSIIDITGDLKIENDQLKSDSLIHSVFKNKDGDIEVIVDHSLPPINGGNGLPAGGIDGSFIRYDELNQVYQSIYTAGKIGYLAQDVNLSDKEKDEAFKSLLSFLNQIYANNIYGYAPKLSIDSMDLYKKSILNTSNKLSKDDVLVKGTFLYAHREKQNDTHGRNFYGWDNGIERFNVSTNTEGLMTSIEKGLTENQTIGIDFGASKQQSKISNSSTLDANSLYLGVHNIYEKGMFKAVFGVGMQTNMYEGERVVKTKYSFSKNNTDFSTLSHNIYLDTSYNFKLNNNVSLIPYYDFTTNIVHMESIKENYTDSSLAISTDKEKVFVIENEIGLKVQTEALTDNTKYKMSAGIAYINRSGNTDYDLKGRIVGGSDFTILGENIEHNNIKGDINFDVEQENGIFYNLNLSAEYGEKERTTYKAQLGLGYKF